MGNTDLRDLATIHEVSFSDLEGTTVSVDFNNWLYRYLTILTKYTDEEVYTTRDGIEVANLLGIIKGVPKLVENGLKPVFVFDGDVLELKEEELQRRRERKEAAQARLETATAEGDEETAARLRARTQRITPTMVETSRELLERLDFPVVTAPAEAEAQAAYMADQGAVDYAGSEDYDTLLFGAPVTLRQLTSSGAIECMELDETLESIGVSLEELVDIAILCGTDYNDGVHGVGPKTALDKISAGMTVEEIIAERDAEIPDLDTIRDIYLHPSVTDQYSIEWEWHPDFDAAEQYLVADWGLPREELETAFDRLTDAAHSEGS